MSGARAGEGQCWVCWAAGSGRAWREGLKGRGGGGVQVCWDRRECVRKVANVSE